MGHLNPQTWDTQAIDKSHLAKDVTELLFPQYIQDVINLVFPKYILFCIISY